MIRTENLSVAYGRGRKVLDGISMDLAEGKIHGLLGLNGSGKTTLLKTICGLIIPQSGSVEIDGADSSRRLPSMLCRLVYVPEEFSLPATTLGGLVATTRGFYPTFSQEMFDNCCRQFRVTADMELGNGSLGETKKAYLAFAIACNTPYLIMDEPTNGLDIPSKAAFRRLIASCACPEKTIIISTHQVADLDKLLDNIVIMDKNGIFFNYPTADISTRLQFGLSEDMGEVIYSEESLTGSIGVGRNATGEESPVDLGLLFNAVTEHREKLLSIFEPIKTTAI